MLKNLDKLNNIKSLLLLLLPFLMQGENIRNTANIKGVYFSQDLMILNFGFSGYIKCK